MVLVKPAPVVQWYRGGFRPVLTLAFEIRTAVGGSRSSGFDSADERRPYPRPDIRNRRNRLCLVKTLYLRIGVLKIVAGAADR